MKKGALRENDGAASAGVSPVVNDIMFLFDAAVMALLTRDCRLRWDVEVFNAALSVLTPT